MGKRPEKDIREKLSDGYTKVRKLSHKLAGPLSTEDYVVQSMPDVSPTKWHLAHTSWFFEAFVLSKVDSKYKSLHPQYNFLFNSYYVQVGERHSRPKRGLISRPTVDEVYDYRSYVDKSMNSLFRKTDNRKFARIAPVIEIGLHHEQQHQELIVTDIKHVLSENPLNPVYKKQKNPSKSKRTVKQKWVEFEGGVYDFGNNGQNFGYDNEFPRHKNLIGPFSLSSRLVTNGEYLEFIEDGSYSKPELWLSDGWNVVSTNGWNAPLYWKKMDGKWYNFTLHGFNEIKLNEPVCHVSFYEAEAFSRWAGARLPGEFEWELASQNLKVNGNFVDNDNFHPVPLENGNGSLNQMYGDVWEWTRSPYSPYPGYEAPPGALGEYNGKFMCNQLVLRGGSCATSKSHIRNSYRNFFPPDARWQFMGIRLAKDA
ncbi:MAG: ergothioneine biosynthesis protein EgtB [Thermodesulfobacteriota bacterium]